MSVNSPWIWRLAGAVVALASMTSLATPARADFFDDARKTFTSDIPHFFQDDIPCAFGGQPTSHTKSTCSGQPARPAPIVTEPAPAPVAPPPPDDYQTGQHDYQATPLPPLQQAPPPQ